MFTVPAGGSENPASTKTVNRRLHYFQMKGKEVYKTAINVLPKAIKKVLDDTGLTVNDIDYMIPHWHIFGIGLLALLVSTILEMITPILIKIAIDDNILKGDSQGLMITSLLYFLVTLSSFLISHLNAPNASPSRFQFIISMIYFR